ncbi:MAG: N-acetyl-gamma-glutamyl-phosphate reductase [Acidobacteria bacterium]|nr:N-acetyl-gamma-glutamyl-phosphate reductase [Acidobacteriota bacterium]
MTARAKVAVVGATGYSGFELAKILLRHPHIERPVFFLRESAGAPVPKCLTHVFPHLRGWGEAPCRPFSVESVVACGAQVAFLATPHEASLEMAPALVQAGLRVVDLSGAFRFREAATFSDWYKLPAPDSSLLNEAVYGMPELYADALPQARLVANPGCYPTSVILGLKPLVEAGWLSTERGVVCDCKSGASGAGKDPKREMQFVEVDENFRAYGLFTHRHTPEVIDHLGLNLRDMMFSTHLLPVARGILSTLYVWLNEKRTAEAVEMLYRFFFAQRPMVRIWPAGKLPELQHVTNTNFCDIGFALDESGERLVIVSCLDNLGKGAAGQAVQNLNFMIGYSESAGLV